MAKANGAEAKAPLIHIVKNDDTPKGKAWLIRGLALLLSFVCCAILIFAISGMDPVKAFSIMLQGTFGFGYNGNAMTMQIKMWDTAIYAAKLLVIAVALAPAFKMKFWNIGAQGQVIIGAMATAFVMRNCADTFSGVLLYVVMILAGILAGAIWGFIPAFFKANWNTNETLFTLMMNYVAIKIMDSFYNSWKGSRSTLETINNTTHEGWFPSIAGQGYTINIIVFLLLAVLMYFYLKRTKHGYEISVVGESQNTAKYAGINVKKVILRTMILSGAVCGVAGALTVAGQTHSISSTTTENGYGFTAIIVAWLAKFNTLGMIGISLLILFLEKGTANLGNFDAAFSTGAGDAIIGLVLFFVIGSEFFINYRIVFNGKKKTKVADHVEVVPLPTPEEEVAMKEAAETVTESKEEVVVEVAATPEETMEQLLDEYAETEGPKTPEEILEDAEQSISEDVQPEELAGTKEEDAQSLPRKQRPKLVMGTVEEQDLLFPKLKLNDSTMDLLNELEEGDKE